MFTNNILVTGGAGYIGSHIIELLIKKKFKVFIFDNLVTGYKRLINKKAIFIKGDIKNSKLLTKTINDNNINSIIHLAGYLNISEGQKNKKKYYKNNVIGTLNLVKACKNSKVKNIIFSSSCSVYGNIKGSVSEKKIPKPKSYYAFTKHKSEEIIKKYEKKFNFKYAILRYFNVAGASQSGKIGEIEKSYGHLIKNLAIQSTKLRPKVDIFGNNYNTKDGTCIRDYIHVSDLADIHILALKKISNGKKSLILNCGYGKGYSVKEVISEMENIIKDKLKVEIGPRREKDISISIANCEKFKKKFNWKPKFNNLNYILRTALEWEKIN